MKRSEVINETCSRKAMTQQMFFFVNLSVRRRNMLQFLVRVWKLGLPSNIQKKEKKKEDPQDKISPALQI